MADDFRLKMRRTGMRKILTSQGAKDAVEDEANKIAAEANATLDPNKIDRDGGYKVSAVKGKKRAHASVIAAGTYAARSNSKHHTLIKEIGKAKGS